jgi:hypothetical protein
MEGKTILQLLDLKHAYLRDLYSFLLASLFNKNIYSMPDLPKYFEHRQLVLILQSHSWTLNFQVGAGANLDS